MSKLFVALSAFLCAICAADAGCPVCTIAVGAGLEGARLLGVDDVITQTEQIISRVKKQSTEIKNLKQEIERYKQMEDMLKSSMYKAEEASNNIKKQAIDEGKMIIQDAKRNASRIVNDALLRSEKIEIKADTLERNIRIFKKKLKLIVEQQLSVVEEIEELSIDD